MESFTVRVDAIRVIFHYKKLNYGAIRKALMRWFLKNQRDLPWRRTRDPYAIWVSEIMLQQTRVVAVIPYYERFLARFPRVQDLAEAAEDDLLRMWAGLGYYSRARNLQKAARQIVEMGEFPSSYEALLALRGIGDYTAGAIASIAFGSAHAAVDGNVRRVIMRLAGNAAVDVPEEAARLLDRRDPGQFNQVLMEIGAVVCLPREPLCDACPVQKWCSARARKLQAELPPRKVKAKLVLKERTLLIVRKHGKILLVPSPRVNGFWDLPEPFKGVRLGAKLGGFRHAITTSQYVFEVREARTRAIPTGSKWWPEQSLHEIALGTVSKKALNTALVAP
jgi:A/G-specific adenine glycosylase